MGIGLFSILRSDRMKGNELKLQQGRFRLGMRRNFTERFLKAWNRLPREVLESPFPGGVSKRQKCAVEGHGLASTLVELKNDWTPSQGSCPAKTILWFYNKLNLLNAFLVL